MQMVDSNSIPIERLQAIAERVAEQRERPLNVMGVISCAATAATAFVEQHDHAEGDPDIGGALDLARGVIDEICGELDPTYFRAEGSPHA
jgi:hypothetical protein